MCFVVCAFPGSGKSSFTKYNANTIDLDSGVVRKTWRELTESGEISETFENYYLSLLKNILDKNNGEKNKGVFMSTHPEMIHLIQGTLNVPIILVYPDINLKDEYLARYRERGDWNEFIQQLDDNFGNYVRDCHNVPLALKSKRVILGRFENLSDRIGFDSVNGFFVKKAT